MKKITLYVALLSLLMFVTAAAQTSNKKYGLKSGIVTFQNEVKMGGSKLSGNKYIVYFDDFGIKECKETYDGETLKESFFSDGTNLYLVVQSEKTVYQRGKAIRGTEMKVDWNEVSEKNKQAGKFKKLADQTILGKKCEAYQYSDKGQTAIYAGWNGVLLFLESQAGTMTTRATATKFEENAKVPAEKFKVPAGYANKKM